MRTTLYCAAYIPWFLLLAAREQLRIDITDHYQQGLIRWGKTFR